MNMSTETLTARYEVLRHGGRRTDVARVVWRGDVLEEANKAFQDVWVKFRNGGVALVDNQEKRILRKDSVGNWRTRP